SGQDNKCQGEFGHDQRTVKAACASSCTCYTTSFLERLADGRTRGTQRGDQSEYNSRYDRDQRRECEDAAINGDLLHSGEYVRAEGKYGADASIGNGKTERAP